MEKGTEKTPGDSQPSCEPNAEKTPRSQPSSERPAIVAIDKMPPALTAKRKQIREMMKMRCQEPGSPIPPKLAMSAADSVFFLALTRATARAMAGKPIYPTPETVTEDIARAAESIETCVMVMHEEVNPPEVPVIQLAR